MPVKAVLFDFGDTLAYHHLSEIAVFNAIFRELGLPERSPSDITEALDFTRARFNADGIFLRKDKSNFDEYWIKWDTLALQRLGVEGDVRRYATETHHRWFDHFTFTLYDDAVPTLKAIRASGRKTAVISNGSEPELDTLFIQVHLDRSLFDAVVGADTYETQKPDSKVFHETLKILGIGASDAVFVGDKLSTDGEGARAAGIKFIHFAPGGVVKTPKWAKRIARLSELPGIL